MQAPSANRRFVLVRRPQGMPVADDFRLEEAPVPEPGDGQFVVRHLFLGMQPAARIRMSELPSYEPPTPIGGVPYAQTVGVVVASRHPGFAPGDHVASDGGWQTQSLSDGARAVRLDDRIRPLSAALGCLGASGLTGYVGLLDIGRPEPGSAVVVSAAAGAVGSVAGQIARIRGCRTVGIAGGPRKCRHVVEELGFDACVDHQAPDFEASLRDACPDGVDVYFDNVGGRVRDAVWFLLNDHARVVLCGLISEYNAEVPQPGPSWRQALVRRITVQGFLVRDHARRRDAFLDDMLGWIGDGRLRYREDVSVGLEQAPAAFAGMLGGRNLGKTLVSI
jgi:NADPH-dependent curcumin reductase